jgi:voltage-gated potassium channel
MAQTSGATPRRTNAYHIFILVLTVYSLVLMVLLLLPLDSATLSLLNFYDNLICIIFLFDFALNLIQAPSKKEYFIDHRGWLDLLGSIPSLGLFRAGALLRLARLSRLARITRLLRGQQKRELTRDIVRNRSQYAVFITFMAALLVLSLASGFILQFESKAPDSNIKSGGDALWWSLVTITTVGYGDRYPVTPAGRVTAVFVMIAGVGIIGALASILASVLVPPRDEDKEPTAQPPVGPTVEQQLQRIEGELVALREIVERAMAR